MQRPPETWAKLILTPAETADSSATVLRYYVWLLYGGTSAIAALTLGALAYFGAVLDPRRRGAGRGGADGPRLLAEVADPEAD